MKKILTIITFAMMFVAAIFFGSPKVINATSEVATPKVVANDYETKQGDYAYIYISADDFVDVSSLEVFVFYDSSLFEFSWESVYSFIDNATYTTNTDTPGEASLYVLSPEGLNGDGTMWCLTFYVKDTTSEGRYPITVAVGDAYSKDLEPIEFETTNAHINVTKRAQIYNTVDIYYNQYDYEIKNEDITEIEYYTYSGYDFASAEFEINYDKNIFELDSVELGYELENANGAIYTINKEKAGYVHISYVALSGINYAYPLLKIRLKVIANVDGETTVDFNAKSMYNTDLVPLNGKKLNTSFKLNYVEPPVVLPAVTVGDYTGCDSEFILNLTVDGSTGLAAADFVIYYDPEIITCSGVRKSLNNSFIVTNPDYKNGMIKFSFIFEDGVTEETIVARLVFSPVKQGETDITVTGNNLVDANFNPIEVEYQSSVVTIEHDVIHHQAKEATCEEIGWNAYETCSRCDYTTYEEIAALGHRVLEGGLVETDTVSFENDAIYPFEFNGEYYYSTNHNDSTIAVFTVQVLYDTTLEIECYTSTETNYDRLKIYNDHNTYADLSGEVSNYTLYISLSKGDYLKFEYYKDGSANNGEDTVYFKFVSGLKVVINDIVEVPAEEVPATCAHDIVCDFCSKVIKEKLPHTLSNYDYLEPSCEENGHEAYEECSRCEYTTYVELPALGHELDYYEYKEPTCEENGHEAYEECSRCEYNSYVELPALGHRVLDKGLVEVDTVSFTNDSNYPFEHNGEYYYSNNHIDGTESIFTIFALYDCMLEIEYYVSSESGCDRLIIYDDFNTYTEISGEYYPSTIGIYLSAGQSLSIKYYKDGSVSYGADTGYFRIISGLTTEVEGLVPYPADNFEPTCVDAVICDYCNKVIKEKLPHNLSYYDYLAPTCEEIGHEAYEMCIDCDYTTYVELPALGHDLNYYEYKDPTCEEIGWYDYETCNRCSYTTYQEISALGHRVIVEEYQYVEVAMLNNDSEYPFDFDGEIYLSTNKDDNSTSTFTIYAYYDFTIEIQYYTSSESGFDKLLMYKNGSNLLEVSGETVWETIYIDLYAGEELYIQYTKDGSAASGYDTAYFRIVTDLLQEHYISYDVSANEVEPTCVDAVICDYCSKVIKEKLPHNLSYYDYLAPTCEEVGHEAYEMCIDCDYTTYEEIEPLGHDFSEVTYEWNFVDNTVTAAYECYNDPSHHNIETVPYTMNVIDSTCTEEGIVKYVSASFDDVMFTIQTYEEIIPILGHNLISYDYLAPTCEEVGHEAYEACSRCDYTTYQEIAALGHDLNYYEYQDPTCEEIGWYDYETCNRCGYNTYVELSALGHRVIVYEYEYVEVATTNNDGDYPFDFDGKVYSSTNKADNSTSTFTIYAYYDFTIEIQYYTSSESGFDKLLMYKNGSNLLEVSGETAWETIYIDLYAGEELLIQYTKDGSVANGNDTAYFSIITDLVQEFGTSYDISTDEVEPTCSSAVICDYCDQTIKEKLPHNSIYYDYLAPTCTEFGHEAYEECMDCGYTTYEEIEPLGHSYDKVIVEPTFEKEGYTIYTCHCGDTYISDYVPTLSHAYGKPTYEWNFEEQTLTAISVCANDSSHIITETVSYSEETVIEATCLSDGLRRYISDAFENSMFSIQIYEETILALGHNLTRYDYLAPTCTEFGHEAYEECSRCDYTTYEEIEPLGHSYDKVIVEPTFEKEGYTIYTCHCGDTYISDYVPTLSHAYGKPTYEWNFEEQTLTAISVCANDSSHIITETVSYSEETVIEATCLSDGLRRYISDEFENAMFSIQTYEDTILALGHTLTRYDYLAPTCEEVGHEAYEECSQCDYTTYQEIAALGHNFSEATYEWNFEDNTITAAYECYNDPCHHNIETVPYTMNVIEASCTEEGIVKYVSASFIDSMFTVQTHEEIIPKLGHDLISYDYLAPTCTEFGYEAYEACSRCDYTTYQEIAALGHYFDEPNYEWDLENQVVTATTICLNDNSHVFTETVSYYKTIAVEATCFDSGIDLFVSNQFINEEFEVQKLEVVIAPLGHKLRYYEYLEPTCTEVGHEAYEECSRCDYTTYKEIEKIAHTYSKTIVNPTCEDQGYIEYKCHCGYSYTDNYLPALGHNYQSSSYEWSDDFSMITASAICTNDTSHILSETLKTTSEVILEPTCENAGGILYTSGVFESSLFEVQIHKVVLPAVGHKASEWIIDLEPTCTNEGSKHIECLVCTKKIKTEIMTKLSHNLTYHNGVLPTCEEAGFIAYETCKNCDYTTYEEISALGHNYKSEIVVPTCKEAGYTYYECQNCKDSYKDEIVPKTGHTFSNEFKYNENVHWKECHCGEKNELSKHNYGDWVIIVESTTDSEGLKEKTCECGYKITATISKKVSKGCGASFTSTLIGFLSLSVFALYISTRKKKEN